MINLLPPETRKAMQYAQRNVHLIRWIVASGGGLAIVGVVIIFGQFFINRSIDDYRTRADVARTQLKLQKVDETQKRVQDISSSLKLVVQVLGREILFSKLLQQIGSAMPVGSSLSGISINKTQGGLDLNAVAKDYQTATQVQLNLQDPNNKIFEKADILNITCNAGNTTDPGYPCQVSLRALFAKNNPFLFINGTGTKQ